MHETYILSDQLAPQDKFWKFATSQWKAVDVTQDSVKQLSLSAATEFLAELAKSTPELLKED